MTYSLVDKLYASKVYTEVVEVLGRKITFRTLGAAEEGDVFRQSTGDSMAQMLVAQRIPMLARGITHIDGVEWKDFDEIKQRLRSSDGMTLVQAIEQELSDPRYTEEVVASLYLAYSDFRGRYRATLDGLKKSSVQPSPATAG